MKVYQYKYIQIHDQKRNELEVKITDANRAEVLYNVVHAIYSEFGRLLKSCCSE